MALWIPVIVVPRSSATVAIETFMTELSSAIRNCPAHSASSTAVAPAAVRAAFFASGIRPPPPARLGGFVGPRPRHRTPSPAPIFGRSGAASA